MQPKKKKKKKGFDIGLINSLLNISPQARDKQIKEIINKMKRQSTEWEKIFANRISNKELISKIKNECIQLKNKNKNNLIDK